MNSVAKTKLALHVLKLLCSHAYSTTSTTTTTATTYSPPLSLSYYKYGKLKNQFIKDARQGEDFMKIVRALHGSIEMVKHDASVCYIYWSEIEPLLLEAREKNDTLLFEIPSESQSVYSRVVDAQNHNKHSDDAFEAKAALALENKLLSLYPNVAVSRTMVSDKLFKGYTKPDGMFTVQKASGFRKVFVLEAKTTVTVKTLKQLKNHCDWASQYFVGAEVIGVIIGTLFPQNFKDDAKNETNEANKQAKMQQCFRERPKTYPIWIGYPNGSDIVLENTEE